MLTVEGICAGKHAIAEHLVQHHDFQLLKVSSDNNRSLADGPEDDIRLQASEIRNAQSPELVFENVDSLIEFVTKRWQNRWVTTDIWDGAILDRLLQRPFFLLVSVDAPVSLRWKRFSNRYILFLSKFALRGYHINFLLPAGAGVDKLILQTLKNLFSGMIEIYTTKTLEAPI